MLCENLYTIQQQINDAASKSNRNPETIRLVAVSKHMPAKEILEAYDCGQLLFGENYLQEAKDKIIEIDNNAISWHFIGQLQSNKASQAAELFGMIESVDRFKIALALNKHASQLDKFLDILIQVNIGREKQKGGTLEEDTWQLLEQIKPLTHLRARGLMTMPPLATDPETSRPYFKKLYTLAMQLADNDLFHNSETIELSMGMSSDFTIAIEEGATLVRIGTALFGPRRQ